MGVDTKIHIPLIGGNVQTTVKEIKKALAKLPLLEIDSTLTHSPIAYDDTNDKTRFNMHETWDIHFGLDYPCDQYESGKEQRRLFAYYDHYQGGNMLYLSMGAWGHNEEIARCLVDSFGGYADYSDCDDTLIDYAMPQPKVQTPAK